MLSNKKIISLISNKILDLILLPTEQCNFRCTYCYEDFSIGKMKPETVQAIKKFLAKRLPELEVLKVSWFGGEPLAAKDIVFEISNFISHYANQRPQLKYTAGMTTNAFTLKPKVLENLVRLNVKNFQISLDGTEEKHNTTRIRMDGKGTFSGIWNNLLAAKKSDLDFNIMLRIHLTPDNLSDIYNLTNEIKSSFNGDKRFSVFFKTIENLGGPNSGSFKTIHGKDKGEILNNFYTFLGNELHGKQLESDGPYVCYAAQPNSLMIRSNGKIGKCTVAFNDGRNDLGQLHSDGTISIDTKKLSLWTRGLKTMDKRDLHCPMSTMPKQTNKLASIPVNVER